MKRPHTLALLFLLLSALSLAAIRLIAQTTGDRSGFLATLAISKNEAVGDVVCYWCRVRVEGAADSDVVSIFGSVEIDGSVAGDVVVVGGGVVLGPSGHVGGDVITLGGPVVRHPQAKVSGEVTANPYFVMPGQRRLFFPSAAMVFLASVAVLATLALLIPQRLTTNVAARLAQRPALAFLIGVVVHALLIWVFSLAEYAGEWEDPISAANVVLLCLLYLLGLMAVSVWVGARIVGGRRLVMIALGAGIVTALVLVPVVGAAVFLLATTLGMGALVSSGFGFRAALSATTPAVKA